MNAIIKPGLTLRRIFSWKVRFALFLIGLSAALHYAHYLIFRDAHHIFLYLLGDIAFVPISVLLVTLVLERFLDVQQKEQRLSKLHMVLDAFFSEAGTPLLRFLKDACAGPYDALRVGVDWSAADFEKCRRRIRQGPFKTDARRVSLAALRDLLTGKRSFLLTLLENPNLLEHDTFTDMLWAITHLTEELMARRDPGRLGKPDLDHLSGDIERAFGRLVDEWLDHMKHLKRDYPYLYSLAVRINPFNPDACAEITFATTP